MSLRPTIREIAAALGVSRTTVSDALRDDPVVALATRERIKLKATEMGYTPDPRLSQLMNHLRQGRGSEARCNLAWFNTWPDRNQWSKPWLARYLEGASTQAKKFGYSLSEIWTSDPSLTAARLPRLLRARGIEGLVLPLVFPQFKHQEYDFGTMSVVVIEEHHPEFVYSRVATNHLYNIHLVLNKIYELGYKRPALRLTPYGEESSGNCMWSVFTLAQMRRFPERPIPILDADPLPHPRAFEDWLREHKPDVLIASSSTILQEIERAGFRVPRDFSLIHMNVGDDTPGWSGISQNHAALGEAAIDVLIAQLNRNEHGFPRLTKEIFVRGQWVDGSTCPPRS